MTPPSAYDAATSPASLGRNDSLPGSGCSCFPATLSRRRRPWAYEALARAVLRSGSSCRRAEKGENMSDVRRIDPGPRLGEASVYGDRMYLSGMIPEDTSLDITGQVKQALAEIDALLKKGGSDKSKILSAVIWLADIGDFAAMNAVWDAWVAPGQAPARATVQARLT